MIASPARKLGMRRPVALVAAAALLALALTGCSSTADHCPLDAEQIHLITGGDVSVSYNDLKDPPSEGQAPMRNCRYSVVDGSAVGTVVITWSPVLDAFPADETAEPIDDLDVPADLTMTVLGPPSVTVRWQKDGYAWLVEAGSSTSATEGAAEAVRSQAIEVAETVTWTTYGTEWWER